MEWIELLKQISILLGIWIAIYGIDSWRRADILIYALNMCHAFGFDPSEVILEKLEINEKKYPVEKAKGSAKKYSET